MAETGAGPLAALRLLDGKETPGLVAEIDRLKAEIARLKQPRIVPEDTRVMGATVTPRTPNGPEEITPAQYNERMQTNPAQTIADRTARKFVIVAK